MNLTLGGKVKAILAVPICFLILFGAYSYYEMNKTALISEKIYNHPYTVGKNVRDLKIKLLEMWTYTEEFYINNLNHEVTVKNSKESLRRKFKQSNKDVQKYFAIIKERFLGDRTKVAETESLYQLWYAKNLTLIAEKDLTHLSDYNHKLEELNTKLAYNLDYLVNFSSKKGKTYFNKVVESNKKASYSLVLFLLIATVFSVIFSYFTTGSINKQLRQLKEDLYSNANQVSNEAKDIAVSGSRLSDTSTEQASSLQETAASLEELSAMVKNNVSQAEASSLKSKEMEFRSSDLKDKMNSIIKSMEEITKSNEDILSLVKVIEMIGEKTQIIDDIVFQTKILSFNASVEAERAGEYGRGFSVVAQEVSKLAQVSGSSSKEISEIVKESIVGANNIARQNTERINIGNKMVVEAAKSLDLMSDSSKEIIQSSENILIASKDQSDGIEQVNLAVSQLDQTTQENAALAEQSASAGIKLNKQSQKMMDSLYDLVKLIDGQAKQNSGANEPEKEDNLVHLAQKQPHNNAQDSFELGKTGTSGEWSDL